MSTTEKYNGYTNYETWVVCLWIDNEQSSYNYVNDVVENAGSVYRAADILKDEYETAKDDILENARLEASVWSDILGHALARVNWEEVARNHKPDEWGDNDETPEETDEPDEWDYCVHAGCWEKVTTDTGVMDHVGDMYCRKHAAELGIG